MRSKYKMSREEKENAIVVKDIYKTFRLPHENHSGLKQLTLGLFQKDRKKGYESQKVLKGVSFEIKKGDFFGIVGRNGSGKSTLLKLLAGIYTPDSGGVDIRGSLIPFIELGVGFNPELTGRENVFLNGALLGLSRDEMQTMYDDIVEFAELEDFMDQKLKNYSSGMQVRLAFSIAIRADADILLLDEVLAVGDEAFQRKCFNYFAELKKRKRTVILVTHSMDAVQQFCNKALMIEKGEVVALGNPAAIAQKYRELFTPLTIERKNTGVGQEDVKQLIDITAKLKRADGVVEISVEMTIKENLPSPQSILSLFVDRDTGEQVYRFSSDEKINNAFELKKDQKIKVNLKIQDIFPNGIFTLRASVKSRDRINEYALFGDLGSFEVDRRVSSGSQWDIHWQPNEEFNIETDDGRKKK